MADENIRRIVHEELLSFDLITQADIDKQSEEAAKAAEEPAEVAPPPPQADASLPRGVMPPDETAAEKEAKAKAEAEGTASKDKAAKDAEAKSGKDKAPAGSSY